MAELRNAWRNLDRLPEVARAFTVFDRPVDAALQYLKLRPVDAARGLHLRGGGAIDTRTYEDLVTAWIIFCRREYRIPAFARSFLDLGANIGCFTLFAARGRPSARVVSFEPMPPTFERLQATIKWNALGRRVTPMKTGVAAQSGTRAIPAGAWPSQSLGMVGANEDAGAGATSIEVVTFDMAIERACAALSVNEIDFVKMDVEGAEHEALPAASDDALRRITTLAMEYHPNGDKDTLFRRIEAGGLKLAHDRPIGKAAGIAHFRR